MNAKPRSTVLITRAADDAPSWVRALEAEGRTVITLPCLAIVPHDDEATRRALDDAIERAAWLALTSVHAVLAVTHLRAAPLPSRLLVAAVGPATARACVEAFGRVDLEADDGTGASLAAALRERFARDSDAPRTIAAPGADRAARHLEAALEPLGVEVFRIAVYRTKPAGASADKQDLDALGVGAILLASPSAVEGLVNCARVPDDALVITIGPATSASARAHGLRVAAEAERPELPAMIEALVRAERACRAE